MNSQPKIVRKIERNIKLPANGVEKRVNEDLMDMERLEAMFKDAPVDGVVPDGFYEVIIEKTVQGETNGGNLKLAWWLRITDGPYEGQMLFKNSVFNTDVSVAYFKKDLNFCGYYPATVKEALSSPLVLKGIQLGVEKVTRNDFAVVYFKEYLGIAGEDNADATELPS